VVEAVAGAGCQRLGFVISGPHVGFGVVGWILGPTCPMFWKRFEHGVLFQLWILRAEEFAGDALKVVAHT